MVSMTIRVQDAEMDVRHWSPSIGDPVLTDSVRRHKWFIDGNVPMVEPSVGEGVCVSLLLVQGPSGGSAIDWGDWVDWNGAKPVLGLLPGNKLELRLLVIGGVLTELSRKHIV